MAADTPAKAPSPATTAYTWTGFYAGGNAGYSWGQSNWEMSTPAANIRFRSDSLHPKGFIGGGQIGFNSQIGSWVWGIEGDYTFRSTSDSVLIPGVGGATGGFRNLGVKNGWLATIRPRVGWAFADVLPYVTGGLAVGNVNNSQSLIGANGITSVASELNSTRTGWTIGGGVEYRIAPRWTAKFEYLYVNLGGTTLATPAGSGFSPATTTFSNKSQIVRAGLNYWF